jgi:archaellum biogenesis protein FlaJ (TadC family)
MINIKKILEKIKFEKKEKSEEKFLEKYCHNLYKYIGRPLLEKKKFKNFFETNIYNSRYEGILKKANLKLIPEEYFISILLTEIALIFLLFTGTIITILMKNPILPPLIFFGGILITTITGILLYNYPVVISKDRGAKIDAAIPYILPYIKILAKELNISKITEIIGDFIIYKEIKIEFQKIKYYSDVLGYDIQSSIRIAMVSCPSRQLTDIMNDLITISNSGGDIYYYLERKLENINQEIEAIEKKNIDTLLIYSQVYVVLLLISPLFFTIMSSILNMIDFNAGVGNSGTMSSISTILIMLVTLPFLYTGFMMLVHYSKPLYARLKPLKQND